MPEFMHAKGNALINARMVDARPIIHRTYKQESGIGSRAFRPLTAGYSIKQATSMHTHCNAYIDDNFRPRPLVLFGGSNWLNGIGAIRNGMDAF